MMRDSAGSQESVEVSQRVEISQDGHTYPVLDFLLGASLTEIVQSIVDGSYSQSSSLDCFLILPAPLLAPLKMFRV